VTTERFTVNRKAASRFAVPCPSGKPAWIGQPPLLA
jgi:hypothetical protein